MITIAGTQYAWTDPLILIVGGVLAAPLAGLLVKRIPTKALTIAVGVLITALAGYQTWQLLA